MSIKTQFLRTMLSVGLFGSIAIATMLTVVIMPNFGALERRSINNVMERAHVALEEYAASLESVARDYGVWNGSYRFMEAPDPAFYKQAPLAMFNLDIDGIAYVRNDGSIVLARWIDLKTRKEDLALRSEMIDTIRKGDLARLLRERPAARSYARIGGKLVAIGIARVRRSDGTGAALGYVMMARVITARYLGALLQNNTRLNLSPASDGAQVELSHHMMLMTVPILGADGKAVADARIRVRRDVSILGQRVLALAIIGAILLFLLILVTLRKLIGGSVLLPLGILEMQMKQVSQSGALKLLPETGRTDEFGSLNRSFNAMLLQLRALREQVEAQSFTLGRNESAVAMMHNVRNALTPITTILSRCADQASTVDRRLVDRVARELAQEDLPVARRRKLAAFLLGAFEAEEAVRVEHARELDAGRDAMRNVLDIIGSHQRVVHEKPAVETCNVTEIIAQNATIARYAGEASIAFSFPAQACHVIANRLLLSQVIGNLFANAGEAIAAMGSEGGRISVTIDRGHPQVVVRIRDDGEGFAVSEGPRLFQRGFSTRTHKSGGLGLHWCANTITAMGGTLRLDSDGPGMGAVAVISLPAAAKGDVDIAA